MGRTVGETPAVSSDLFEWYEQDGLPTRKSRVYEQSRMTVIGRLVGCYSAASLTPKVLAAYRDGRLERVSGHTVRKALHLIGRVLKHPQREWEINLPRATPLTP